MNSIEFEVKTSDISNYKSKVKDAVAKAAHMISGYAADDCAFELNLTPRRIDTGRLRDSIDGGVKDGDTVIVGTDVEYAIYVHEGTFRMAPNRFLKNGITNNIEEYMRVLEKCLKEIQ